VSLNYARGTLKSSASTLVLLEGAANTVTLAVTTPSAARIFTFPDVASDTVVLLAATQTLTNKTLTSPKLNEAVAITATATQVNYLAAATGTTGTTSQKLVFDTSPTLVSPILTTPDINAGTADSLTALSIRDTSAAFDLTLAATSSTPLSAGRTLTLDVVNAARTVKLQGNVDLGGTLTTAAAFTTSGANALTLTTTGVTNVTLPTTGTLATKAGAEVFTNKDYDGGTASDTSRLTVPKAAFTTLDGLTDKEATLAYDTTSGSLMVNNGSTWSAVGSGAGSGEKNYIENPSAATAITGWTAVSHLTVARTTTAADLPREYTTGSGVKITATASQTQSTSTYVYYDFTLDDVDLNKKLKIQWSQKTTGTYTAGQLAVIITTQADRTTAVATPVTTEIPAADGVFTTSFDTGSTATLSLVIRATGDMSDNGGITISDVVVGPGTQPQGAVVTEWLSYTPTGSWLANTTYTGKWRRVGGNMDVSVKVAVSGAPTSAALTVNLPTDHTIDTTALVNSTSDNILGRAYVSDTGINTYPAVVKYSSTSAVGVSYLDDAASGVVVQTTVTQAAPFTFASGDFVTLEFTVPIAEWAGSGTLNVAQNDVEYGANTAGDADDTSGTNSINSPAGAELVALATVARTKYVVWPTPVQSTDVISLQFSYNRTEWIDAAAFTTFILGTSGAVDDGSGVRINTPPASNRTSVTFGQYRYVAHDGTATNWASGTYWRLVKAKAGAAVGFGKATQSSLGLVKAGQVPGTNTNDSAETGAVGEYVYATVPFASADALVTGTIEDLASISLSAGDWDISAIIGFTGAPTGGSGFQAGIGTNTTSFIGGTGGLGDSYVEGTAGMMPASGWNSSAAIPAYRVSISSTTSYYLNARADFTGGTCSAYGRISARRVR
jgi:hypothetical protein